MLIARIAVAIVFLIAMFGVAKFAHVIVDLRRMSWRLSTSGLRNKNLKVAAD